MGHDALGRMRVPPSAPSTGVTYRIALGRFRLWPGLTRGLIALVIIGTLVAAQLWPPEGASPGVAQVVQTLAIAVVAFYFGSRITVRPKTVTPETATPERPDGSAEPK